MVRGRTGRIFPEGHDAIPLAALADREMFLPVRSTYPVPALRRPAGKVVSVRTSLPNLSPFRH